MGETETLEQYFDSARFYFEALLQSYIQTAMHPDLHPGNLILSREFSNVLNGLIAFRDSILPRNLKDHFKRARRLCDGFGAGAGPVKRP